MRVLRIVHVVRGQLLKGWSEVMGRSRAVGDLGWGELDGGLDGELVWFGGRWWWIVEEVGRGL